ncbi:MAG: hypothetical protein MUC68_05485 [Burkholderiaceae bacterium]|jgi:hypothetical protein|nr:hypothetical protein [Burkholderiaceae bacterium]
MPSIDRRAHGLLCTLTLPVVCALAPAPTAAANGSALADQTRWIHRLQAQCAKAAAARCVLIERSSVASPEIATRKVAIPDAASAASTRPRKHRASQIAPGHIVGGR